MKSNLKIDNKNYIAEVSISNMIEPDEQDIHNNYMNECMANDAMFVDTAGMCTSDAKYVCGMSYMKNKAMLNECEGQLTEKQKSLPPSLQKSILKRQHKSNKLNENGKKQADELGGLEEAKAEPTGVFVKDPAAPSGEITEKLAAEGLKQDEKLKIEQDNSETNDVQLQSKRFEMTED